jgi:hypothetical protein
MRKSMSLLAMLAIMFALPPRAASAQQTAVQAWVSGTGSDANTAVFCSRFDPCLTLAAALSITLAGGTVSCADPGVGFETSSVTITRDVTIDCPAGFGFVGDLGSGIPAVVVSGAGIRVTLRGLVIYGNGESGVQSTPQPAGIQITAPATVRIENCKIYGIGGGPGILVSPTSAGTAVVKIQDSTFTRSAGGIGVTPSGGASVLLSVERSRIENNTGGGIRIDSSNAGSITADVTDSSVSFNGSNGINVVSGSGGSQNVLNLSGGILASNGGAGLQANGTNAAALVKTTSLSNNATALAAVGGGRILTYGNNSVVGSAGTGFTGSASLQ